MTLKTPGLALYGACDEPLLLTRHGWWGAKFKLSAFVAVLPGRPSPKRTEFVLPKEGYGEYLDFETTHARTSGGNCHTDVSLAEIGCNARGSDTNNSRASAKLGQHTDPTPQGIYTPKTPLSLTTPPYFFVISCINPTPSVGCHICGRFPDHAIGRCQHLEGRKWNALPVDPSLAFWTSNLVQRMRYEEPLCDPPCHSTSRGGNE